MSGYSSFNSRDGKNRRLSRSGMPRFTGCGISKKRPVSHPRHRPETRPVVLLPITDSLAYHPPSPFRCRRRPRTLAFSRICNIQSHPNSPEVRRKITHAFRDAPRHARSIFPARGRSEIQSIKKPNLLEIHRKQTDPQSRRRALHLPRRAPARQTILSPISSRLRN